jgi:hypothetical protein
MAAKRRICNPLLQQVPSHQSLPKSKVWGQHATITAANVKLEDFKYSYIFEIMDQVMKAVDIKSSDLIDAGMNKGLRNDMPQLLTKFKGSYFRKGDGHCNGSCQAGGVEPAVFNSFSTIHGTRQEKGMAIFPENCFHVYPRQHRLENRHYFD